MQYRSTFFLAVLLAVAACKPTWSPRAILSPTIALQCAPERPVYCAEDLSPERCELVIAAVEEVNAVVPDLLVYAGHLTWEQIAELQRAKTPITVWASLTRAQARDGGLPETVLGVTMLRPNDATMCVEFVPIALVWAEGELTPKEEAQVVRHELMHSLGAGHADPESRFSTIMRPGLSSERREGLSKADRNWLRAVYRMF